MLLSSLVSRLLDKTDTNAVCSPAVIKGRETQWYGPIQSAHEGPRPGHEGIAFRTNSRLSSAALNDMCKQDSVVCQRTVLHLEEADGVSAQKNLVYLGDYFFNFHTAI